MEKDLFGICPYMTDQKLLAGKWSILIMHHLSEEPIRFYELQRRLPDMTHATSEDFISSPFGPNL